MDRAAREAPDRDFDLGAQAVLRIEREREEPFAELRGEARAVRGDDVGRARDPVTRSEALRLGAAKDLGGGGELLAGDRAEPGIEVALEEVDEGREASAAVEETSDTKTFTAA